MIRGIWQIRSAVVGLALLSTFLAQPAQCQDVGSPGWMNLSARWGASAGIRYQISADAPDLAPVPNTRLQGSATISRLFMAARFDADAVTVGEESYRSLEGHLLVGVRAFGPFAPSLTWGYEMPALGESGRDLEIFGGGIFVGQGLYWNGRADAWAYVGVVKRRGVGELLVDEPSWRPVAALQIPLRDKVSAIADVMGGPGWEFSAGASVSLP